MNRTKYLITVAGFIGLLSSLLYVIHGGASETPTIEQLLPPADVAHIERIRDLFETEPDVILIAIVKSDRPWSMERLSHFQSQLQAVAGVTQIWVAPLAIDTAVRLLVLTLERGAVQLSRARTLTAEIEHALQAVIGTGERVHLIGTPQLRAASWAVTEADLWRMLPLLGLVIVVVPTLFFGSLRAVGFPLCIAALTTVACLALYRLFNGPPDALALLLVPMIWSVATMDAMHLYHRAHINVSTGNPHPFVDAAAELYRPCLMTTLTTAGGLAALSLQEDSQLIRTFGIWAAVGTCLAYAFTFVLGHQILALFGVWHRPPQWPRRLIRMVMLASQRYASRVGVIWFGLVLAALGFISQLHVQDRFPHVFAPSQPLAQELRAMETLLGIHLSPLDIYVEASNEHGRRPIAVLSAMLAVTNYLETLPEARMILPKALLDGTPHLDGLTAVDTMQRRADLTRRIERIAHDPRLASWLRAHHHAGRLQVYFSPLAFERKREILDWLRRFDTTMLSTHRLSFGGSGYHYFRAEERGRHATLVGGGLSLVVMVGGLAWAFRQLRLLLIAVICNILPLILVGGMMGLIGLPWSLALLPLPAVLFGLAVDDSIHLLWPWRHPSVSAKRPALAAARQAGPALLATTATLAGGIATLSLSGLQPNRELGFMLPLGLFIALACDLTLLPALITISRHK